jgi:uncharacterized protein YndB with AHSA1/START domain
MGPVSAEIEIDAPREQLFAVLADLSLRPSFTDHFLAGFHLTRIEPVGVGAGARFRVDVPLRKVWMDTAIVESDDACRIVEQGEGGRNNRIRTHTVWELKTGTGSLTAIRVAHWTEPTLVDRPLELLSGGSIWVGRGWKRALQRLRDNLESEQPAVERIGVAGGNRHATGIP